MCDIFSFTSCLVPEKACRLHLFFEGLVFYRSLAVASSAPYDAVGSDIQPLRICAKSWMSPDPIEFLRTGCSAGMTKEVVILVSFTR